MNFSIWQYENLKEIVKTVQKDKATVLVGGCFDLIHFGHVTFLTRAKMQGDILIVALEHDTFSLQRKHRESIHTQDQRAQMLCALRCVDAVIPLPYFSSHEEYDELVKTIHPNVIAITQGDPHVDQKKAQAQRVGARLETVSNLLSEYSTSNIIQKLS